MSDYQDPGRSPARPNAPDGNGAPQSSAGAPNAPPFFVPAAFTPPNPQFIMKPPAPEPPATARDLVFDGLSLAFSFLFVECILFGGLGVAVPLVLLLCYALAAAYLSRGRLHLGFSFVCTAVPVAALLLCYLLYDNLTLRFFNTLILLALIPLNLSYLAGRNEYRFFCGGSLLDALKAMFVFPFANMGRALTLLRRRGGRSGRFSGVLKVLLGVLLISPVALIVTALLMSSDVRFSDVISQILHTLGTRWLPTVGKILLSALLTCPGFGFLYALRYGTHNPQAHTYSLSKRLRVLDISVVNSALWVVSMIYLLYISTQISYFFSAFVHQLPNGIETYAEYARRGFFELSAVCAINFCLIALTMTFSRRRGNRLHRASRVTIFALSALTLMLIATAMSKMILYIQERGLTPLRLYTSAFMLLLFVVFAFLTVKMFTDRFNFLRSSAIAAVVIYLMLNFSCPDQLIARHNLALYRAQVSSGQEASLDTDLLFSLSDSALPEALPLLSDPVNGGVARQAFRNAAERLQAQNWESFTVAGEQARRAALKAVGGAAGS